MTHKPGPAEKLSEIQELARACNRELQSDFERIGFRLGGNLFLGEFYAESKRIYFGANPGDVGANRPFWVELETERNAPFDFPPNEKGKHRYWDNCKRFLDNYTELAHWFNDHVTSTFLVPWRTSGLSALYALDRQCSGRILKFSSMLVGKMFEHHNPEVVIVAGKGALHLLNKLLTPRP